MVRKALIPIAGKATRMMPLASVVPKAMLPLVSSANQIQCVLHVICEQAMSAGIESIGIIVSPQQTDMVRRYFTAVRKGGFGQLPAQIEYITQETPQGFGDAVLQGRDFIGDEPFMLLLGDHIHVHDDGRPPCAAQIAKAFDCCNSAAMVGVQSVWQEELSKVGVAGGVRIKQDLYRCTRFIEKPDAETARLELTTSDLPEGAFLAHCGIYVFSPEIFDCLEQISASAQKAGAEAELADAQTELLKRHPEEYFLCKIAGKAYDLGNPAGYARAQAAFGSDKNKRVG